MVISRDDLELLNAVGWTVIVTNGNTTIQKEGGNLIDNQDDIKMIIAEENINQKNQFRKLFPFILSWAYFYCFWCS